MFLQQCCPESISDKDDTQFITEFRTSFSRSPRLLSLDFGLTNTSSDLARLALRKSAACEALRPAMGLGGYLSPWPWPWQGDLDCDLECRTSRLCLFLLSRVTAELSESLGTSSVSWGVSPESSFKRIECTYVQAFCSRNVSPCPDPGPGPLSRTSDAPRSRLWWSSYDPCCFLSEKKNLIKFFLFPIDFCLRNCILAWLNQGL